MDEFEWQKGSEWRKWDLHVHSPASHNFIGSWEDFIIQIGNADCDVIGINDYFSVAGYAEVRRRLLDTGRSYSKNYLIALDRLRTKAIFPVIECRMNNLLVEKKVPSGVRLNFHIIFDPALDQDNIETFIKSMPLNQGKIGVKYKEPQTLLVDSFQHLIPALGGSDDRLRVCRPDEGLGLRVVGVDEGVDCLLEVHQ